MGEQDRVAVIGAGIIGCAIACGLARAGRRVLLADPEEPGVGGASFGNVGHIAAELVEPLPSPALLFGFWRELFAFGGSLDIPWRRLPHVALWARPFAAAAKGRAQSATCGSLRHGMSREPPNANSSRQKPNSSAGEGRGSTSSAAMCPTLPKLAPPTPGSSGSASSTRRPARARPQAMAQPM